MLAARREMERVSRARNLVSGLLASREQRWSRQYAIVRDVFRWTRWSLIGLLCLGIGWLGTMSANSVFLGSVAALATLAVSKIFDSGAQVERNAAEWLTRWLVEPSRQVLDNELGHSAPAALVELGVAGLRIQNKDEILATLIDG